jgi:hypothetical protein
MPWRPALTGDFYDLASWFDLWLYRRDLRASGGRLAGMTFKAVNLDGGKRMATLAKVTGPGVDALTGLTGVASHTGFQRIFAGANAAMQGVVTLVLEQLHVVAAHESRVGHTLAAPCFFNQRS